MKDKFDLELQPASLDIWKTKYRLKDGETEEVVDENVEGTFDRVAGALVTQERNRKKWKPIFKKAMLRGVFPAGRIIANAGAESHKPATSTINCTVSGIVGDSMEDILQKVKEAGITLKAGCGIGYEFSTLRPSGSFVHGSGAATSGPLSFMDVFDSMCFTVSSAGGRRGAQMSTFSIEHADVVEYIKAKREDGRLRQFNMSVLITDKFIDAVNNDEMWDFKWKSKNYGDPIRARELWDLMMKSTYDYAEPGFILIDRVNKMNNNWFCEDIRATNPCFSGDTLIAVADGRKAVSIKQLSNEGKDIPVYCYGDGETRIRKGRSPRKTGTKQLYKVTLDDKSSIKVTGDHKWILSNHDVKTTLELSSGDSLLRFDRKFSTFCSRNEKYYHEINGELEHRLIGKENIGRSLLPYPDEIAHHKDNDMYNNSPSNIEVMSQSDHNSLHWKGQSFGTSNGNSTGVTISDHYDLMYMMIKELDRMPSKYEYMDECVTVGFMKSSKSNHDFTLNRTIGSFQSLVNYFSYSDIFRCTSHYKDSTEITVVDALTGKKFTRKDPRWYWKTNKKLIKIDFESYGHYLTYNEKFEVNWDSNFGTRNEGIQLSEQVRRVGAYAKSKGKTLTLDNWDTNESWMRSELGGFIDSTKVKQVYTTNKDLELASEVGNHSVISIDKYKIEDVYNITVDQYHNLGVISSLGSEDVENSKKDCHSGVFMRNCGKVN